jgi:hypothetical protein
VGSGAVGVSRLIRDTSYADITGDDITGDDITGGDIIVKMSKHFKSSRMPLGNPYATGDTIVGCILLSLGNWWADNHQDGRLRRASVLQP